MSAPSLPELPVVAVLPELAAALDSHRAAVLEAPPGAGKSTVVPLALLEAGWLAGQRIVMLEPRRVAARAVAQRMATTLGEAAGQTVGYRTRTETRVGPRTRIEVVTEGILTRRLQHDPTLEGVGCVIFDEFHERNLNADLGLALTLDVQAQLRGELRVLVMSATLDGAALARLLGAAPRIRAQGRVYPVETVYVAPAPGRPEERIEQRMAAAISRALVSHAGNLLAFLPGAGEIRRIAEQLATTSGDALAIRPLYGELPSAAQDAALRPEPDRRRKLVLATNLAETSLTIEGVDIVIDGGYERRPRFDPASGMSGLELRRISQASAEQRRGRAGRTALGTCYRLWSETTQASLAAQTPPEIVEADLASLALELACWGAADLQTLRWLDPPPEAPLAQARALLHGLEAIDAAGRITPLGRRMATLGLHPRLAHMVLRALPLGQARLAMELAALLSERDLLRAAPAMRDPDVRLRIDVLHGAAPPAGLEIDRGTLQRIRQSVDRLQRELNRHAVESDVAGVAPVLDTREALPLLLAFAYPDRIGRARDGGGGRYLLSGGRGAAFAGPTALARSECIVVAALDLGDREARIALAAPVEQRLLETHLQAGIEQTDTVAWEPRSEAVLARRQARLGALLLRDEPLANPDAATVTAALLEGLRALGLAALPWRPELEQWRARVAFARVQEPQGGWPDLSDAALAGSLGTWLEPWLAGITRRDQLARIDLRAALSALLDRRLARRLDEFAPTQLIVPSGSRIPIDYAAAAPTLSVRLQEVFGLAESPRIAGGRVPLTMELLSPARRPVQVTRDLASFWARGYAEVRRELKGRYPKHYWPEDPHQAEATRRVRPG